MFSCVMDFLSWHGLAPGAGHGSPLGTFGKQEVPGQPPGAPSFGGEAQQAGGDGREGERHQRRRDSDRNVPFGLMGSSMPSSPVGMRREGSGPQADTPRLTLRKTSSTDEVAAFKVKKA